MPQGLDTEMVRQYYQAITDEELMYIIANDGIVLTAEAKEIAREEAIKRTLSPEFQPLMNAQLKSYSDEEIEMLCETIQKLSCPVCGMKDMLLNMTHVMSIASFIVITSISRQTLIACPGCMDKAMSRATIQTIVLGWWGLPWGLIRTVQALSNNASYRRSHHAHVANEALRSFVSNHAGIISIHKQNVEQLSRIILCSGRRDMEER